MTNLLPIVGIGFIYGLRHATDPDHVVAVTTIVARQRTMSAAAAIGAAWGVGHTLTMLVVGGGIIVFGWVIPTRIGLSTELSVGIMLIVLGIMTLANRHDHQHDHQHELAHRLDHRFGAFGPYRLVRPLLVGIVHGLAGSAAAALLILALIPNPRWGVLFLLIFGLGTIVGMMLMTAAIVVPFAQTEARVERLNRALRLASGLISVAFGLFVAYRIGIVDGLFTGTPRWTPE
jgi:ABC-type nickel/cobalt efflux system permease component RcnA